MICLSDDLYLILSNSDGASSEQKMRSAARIFAEDHDIPLDDADSEIGTLRIARTETGKPYFPDCPQIKVSISHSGSLVLCAVSCSEVGVDLQQHTRMKGETKGEALQRFRKIAKRFFHEDESHFVERGDFDDFFKIWTAKECYVKFTGQGMDSHYGDFSVIPADPALLSSRYVLDCPVQWNAMDLCFTQILIEPDYTICVCAQGKKNIVFSYII